ncbi:unnamed protein product [Spirodela intermedia]|uniref:Uncharacterized protein n=1 Tax=Spirodela intermedia TaxID=51605 RepID=A0A7I8JJC7_SPIIN|nr:unnamed protein product [Spirodela intermedia]CAA6669673.1 unnamed protein product [Spirodela intermedia]
METQVLAGGCPIKTVVVLVQENRSFDHMLGWMKSLNPAIDGVDGSESNLVSVADPNSARVQFTDRSEYVDPDPGHSFQAIYEQIYGVPYEPGLPSTPATAALMNGFAQQAEKEKPGMSANVMSGFRPNAVPVYRELVAEFAVCDRWFAPVPASTQPNRLYVHSATSHGATSNVRKQLIEGFPQKTIFDSLDEAGLSFGIYFQYPPATLFYRSTQVLGEFHPFDLSFKKHCKEGKLPNYVVVEQRYFDLKLLPGNDDHPSHDVSEGQKFVKEVYEALPRRLLRPRTPPVNVPSPDDIVGPEPFNFRFDRLGVRVPAILISPWIEKGTVLHEPSGPYPSSQYEHSSIPATVKKIFNLREFLTKRDAWAGTFETKMREDDGAGEGAKLTEFQEALVHLAAVLNGDHAKEGKLKAALEEKTVVEGAKYLEDAFQAFCRAGESCRKRGMDDSQIVAVEKPGGEKPKARKRSFVNKLFSCLACNRSE